MADIRIRQVDPALHRGLKKSAVDAGLSLEEYCRRLLMGRGVEGHAQGKPLAGTGLTQPNGGGGLAAAQQVSSPAAPSDTGEPARDPEYRIDDIEAARCASEALTAIANRLVPGTPEAESPGDEQQHDPEYCQQPGCRECKRLRDGQ